MSRRNGPTKKPSKKPTILSLTRALRKVERERDALIEVRDKAPEFDDVMSVARKWHYTEIRDIVEGAIRAVNDPNRDRQDLDARAFLGGYLESQIDPARHLHCIVPAMTGMVLACSDNAGAYEDEFGPDAEADDATRAAHAMRVDAWQLLEARSDEWEHHTDEGDA